MDAKVKNETLAKLENEVWAVQKYLFVFQNNIEP
jgi:hypothetical protein